MAVKEKQTRHGVFITQYKHFTGKDLRRGLETAASELGRIGPILDQMEQEGMRILKEQGYLTKAGKLPRRKVFVTRKGEKVWEHAEALPQIITDVEMMLLRIKGVRQHWRENKIEEALFDLYFATNAVWRAKIRPIEPALRFRDHREMARRRGADQTMMREPMWRRWQKEADKIRSKNPGRKFSRKNLAGKVKEHLKLIETTETIRKRIH